MANQRDVWRPVPVKALRWTASAIAASMLLSGAGAAKQFGPWGPAVTLDENRTDWEGINTPATDGCPILSPYDQSLYMASNRPGSVPKTQAYEAGLDIWIAPRSGDGWGEPVPAGPEINTSQDEFCPTPARGNRFYFVRRSSASDTDIYVVKKLPKGGWGEPQRLPKGAPGDNSKINSDAEEWSPSVYEAPDGTDVLYFSSTRFSSTGPGGPTAKQDIFYSANRGPAQLANGVNSDNSNHSDARPNVRRDGLEIVFDSTRQGGPPDIWSATRPSVNGPWNAPVPLPDGINSPAGESRPSLSWDGTILLFGTTRLSGSPAPDIFMSSREKITGRK